MGNIIFFILTSLDGGWSTWSEWGGCSATCGDAYRKRSHTCTNPAPLYGGKDCGDALIEHQPCQLAQCPIGLFLHCIKYDGPAKQNIRNVLLYYNLPCIKWSQSVVLLTVIVSQTNPCMHIY